MFHLLPVKRLSQGWLHEMPGMLSHLYYTVGTRGVSEPWVEESVSEVLVSWHGLPLFHYWAVFQRSVNLGGIEVDTPFFPTF